MGSISADQFSPLNKMEFSPDGSIFACGYEEGQCRIFKMDSDFERRCMKISKAFVNQETNI